MTDEPDTTGDASEQATPVVVDLQPELRSALKDPFGPVYTDVDGLLADAGTPLVAVGDIVTYHLLQAGQTPDVALIDGRTKRSAVEEHIQDALDGDAFDRERHVANPPGALSKPLLTALGDALAAEGTTVVVVDGEEDLAALPAIATAPAGASVVYGQPDEGMVLVTCNDETVETVRDLLSRMDGDTERLWDLLDG